MERLDCCKLLHLLDWLWPVVTWRASFWTLSSVCCLIRYIIMIVIMNINLPLFSCESKALPPEMTQVKTTRTSTL